MTTEQEVGSAPAEPTAGSPIDWERQADQTLASLRGRFRLTDDQVGRIRPILAGYLPRLRAMFDSYAGEGIETAPALLDQFRQARAGLQANLEPILDDAQEKEFLVLRREVDAEIKKAFVEARIGWFRNTLGIDDAGFGRQRRLEKRAGRAAGGGASRENRQKHQENKGFAHRRS